MTTTININDAFNVRRSQIPCLHFSYTTASTYHATSKLNNRFGKSEKIVTWIQQNLKGKYYLRTNVGLDDDGKVITHLLIGFENPRELTYFNLACPHLA